MLMEDRFDHSSAVTTNGMYIFGSKRGMRRPGMDSKTGPRSSKKIQYKIWLNINLNQTYGFL